MHFLGGNSNLNTSNLLGSANMKAIRKPHAYIIVYPVIAGALHIYRQQHKHLSQADLVICGTHVQHYRSGPEEKINETVSGSGH